MANDRILKQINGLYEQYCDGVIGIEEFGKQLSGRVEAMEGLDYHPHLKRSQEFIHLMENPEWASDGNIPDSIIDESAVVAEFCDWLKSVEQFVEHGPSNGNNG